MEREAPHIKVHPNPIWRSRANFIVAVKLEHPGYREQLWARSASATRFEICCIPLFAYDIALGDFVETDADYNILRVARPSGRYVFRAWFGQSDHPQDDIVEALTRLGAQTERYSKELLAIDTADARHAQAVADFLSGHENQGRLIYETGRQAGGPMRNRLAAALSNAWKVV